MYNVFLLSSKKIPFEQYYRLHLSEPNVAICEKKSNKVFVLSHTSFDKNNFYFLHAVQEAVDAFNEVLKHFRFFNDCLRMIHQNTLFNTTLPPTLKTSNLAFCNRFFIFSDFHRRHPSQLLYLRRLSSQFLLR